MIATLAALGQNSLVNCDHSQSRGCIYVWNELKKDLSSWFALTTHYIWLWDVNLWKWTE